ncbi:MAG: translational GTPase TypA [Patescibacteria group bacterium]|jgi:GTP-binding protein|nr:translational GTPase TypA [Patescibacteria group bacterium]
MEIRNIAIIAHVDHGKTTLTDALMKQTGMISDDSSMDSNDLEKERGITIYSKNTSINYKDTKINIVDTPGHADFGSEVERVLRAIDSVVLVVDAQEGPMPQTRFVLKKSLELGLKPIVVLNKIDKPAARPEEVVEMVYELFLDLGANDEQLDFTTLYAIAREGIAKNEIGEDSKDLTPLLETIIKEVPIASKSEEETKQASLKIQPFNLAYDNFLGRLAIARVYDGIIKNGQSVFIKKINGETSQGKITKLFTFHGTERKEIDQTQAGDIVMIAGLSDVYIGQTICDSPDQEPLPIISIDEPTISLDFLVNTSPFAGQEGDLVTNIQIKERLQKELEVNVGLKIDFSSSESYEVSGRGELHIAILLENMRREGYEIQVSQPKVIIKEENGQKLEPFEEATIEVPEEYAGTIIEKLGKRKGIMIDMKQKNGISRMIFEIPTRGLLGYRGQFVVDTKGEGIFCSRFLDFRPFAGEIKRKETGSMISMINGKALGFSLYNLQQRGELYINAATQVYEGLVIGNTSRGEDIAVNPTKGKQLTNMRSAGNDDAIQLIPPKEVTIETGLEIMSADEYLEVTPKSVRLRKKHLTENERIRAKRRGK